MKKSATQNAVSKEEIFRDAEKVFSAGYVKLLREKGHDFLEQEYSGSALNDSEGKSYLDCCTSSGSFNLGRKNAAIVKRFKEAIYETDQGNFVMPSQEKAVLAKKISGFVPGNLDCLLYGVTRGESMEAACKLARGFTARPELVTVDGACYGESGFALSLSERKDKEQFGQLIPSVNVIPWGDVNAAAKVIGRNTAAVIMEPIQAENHCRTADKNYYARIRELCDKTGAKLIFDETQSGFGRTGAKFFFEQIGVTPDILIIGEAVTSGAFPMTAMVFTSELKGFFDIHPLIHLCTFGGHDLGCLVAMEALDEYNRLKPWINAKNVGDVLINGLSAVAVKNSGKVISVEGCGLLISLKLANQNLALKFCAAARNAGLLVNSGLVDRSAILIRPSLLIGREETEKILDIVAQTLKSI